MSGPQLNAMVMRLRNWYVTQRQILIAALEEGGPYGTIRLTPSEQLDYFLNMTPEDWAALVERLRMRFRGLPDAEARVKQGLTDFIAHMYTTEERVAGGPRASS